MDALFVHSVRDLFGCGVEGCHALAERAGSGCGPGPKGERLDLRLSGPGFDWGRWFTVLEQSGVRGMTPNDDPVQYSALKAPDLDRQPCTCNTLWGDRSKVLKDALQTERAQSSEARALNFVRLMTHALAPTPRV